MMVRIGRTKRYWMTLMGSWTGWMQCPRYNVISTMYLYYKKKTSVYLFYSIFHLVYHFFSFYASCHASGRCCNDVLPPVLFIIFRTTRGGRTYMAESISAKNDDKMSAAATASFFLFCSALPPPNAPTRASASIVVPLSSTRYT